MAINKAETSFTSLIWEKFIKTGQLEYSRLRPEIAQSWLRCAKAAIDPFAKRSVVILARHQLAELLEKRKNLIDVARPFMENIYSFVASSSFVVVLCDERGYIMETIGATDVIKSTCDLNFCRGALWTEPEIGNNAAGTALLLKKPVQISGAEHYCQKHHSWTCSGAPIFNDQNQLIGVLEMSGPVEKTHQHTLGMVVAAVAAIQHQIREQQKNRELTLLNNRLNSIFLTVSDGVIVVNSHGTIKQVNPMAERILDQTVSKINGSFIGNYLERYSPVKEMLAKGKDFNDLEVNIKTGTGMTNCLASGKPIKDDQNSITGGVIFINPINKIKKLINRFNGAHATFNFDDILGQSKLLLKAIKLGFLAAGNNSNVLLCGESGTGKEMFAQSIHNKSSRRNGPFVAVNCGAIPRELIGSELFGYVEGAFTGAYKGGRPGKFELASGGTLFLDEIGDMPLEQQVALLRVLQDKTVTRIGDDKAVVVDVRIICATNKDLHTEINKGNFRQDLYYRLNVISIKLPPLRSHREDIPLLFKAFLKNTCDKLGICIQYVNQEVIAILQQYNWPGNVREFQNVVERVVNIATGPVIKKEHLPEEILSPHPVYDVYEKIETAVTQPQNAVTHERSKIKKLLAEKEREEILTLLSENNGNVSQVARELSISRNSLYRKMKKLNIMP